MIKIIVHLTYFLKIITVGTVFIEKVLFSYSKGILRKLRRFSPNTYDTLCIYIIIIIISFTIYILNSLVVLSKSISIHFRFSKRLFSKHHTDKNYFGAFLQKSTAEITIAIASNTHTHTHT
jgi:hypothetical protein